MTTRYGCVCCAVPQKLLRHLADQAEGEHRQLLSGQMEQAARLRGQRAALSKKPVPAKTGAKLLYRQVFDGQGQGFLPGVLLRDEDDPPVRDKAANQAYENVGIALQFLSAVLGRDSVDGKGMRIDATVHYGYGFANAMWTGEQMIVGDGDGTDVRNLAGSLGIIAHEFSHGISQHLVKGGLGVVQIAGQPPALKGEAGALNESFSDVFASMIKQWHAGEKVSSADWLMGEDILAPHAGKAVRSLKDPGNRKLTWPKDDQLKSYKALKPTDDVHKASGISNYAFYLAAMELDGYSWETLAAPWLKGYDKLRARATFLDAAHATTSAAAAQHGAGSRAHQAVKNAWRAVHVLQ